MDEEEAKRLQDGINVINSVLSRFTTVSSGLSVPTLQNGGSQNEGQSGTCSRVTVPTLQNDGSQNEGRGGACSRALQALRSVRHHLGSSSLNLSREQPNKGKNKAIQNEQRKNFAPYAIQNRVTSKCKGKGRVRGCSFKTVCLSSPQDTHVPSTVSQKETLLQAGLGQNTVSVPDSSCSKDEFWSVISSVYPKLANCGGFELLRCVSNSKELEPISRSVSRSPKLLKAIIGNSKIYIRPLQKNLDLEAVEEEESSSMSSECFEKCIYCGKQIDLSMLREHANHCRQKQEYNLSDDDDFQPKRRKLSPVLLVSSGSDDDLDDLPCVNWGGSPQQSTSQILEDVNETESIIMGHALEIRENVVDDSQSQRSTPTLESILTNLCRHKSESITFIPIRREHVLLDALRSVKRTSFCYSNTLKVEFLGELGADGGGPSREFWCCLAKEIEQSLCEGKEGKKVFRHNAVALQENTFYHVGVLMALSLLHGGSGFPYLANSTYEYLSGIPVASITVKNDEVPSYEVEVMLDKIEAAEDTDALQQLCMEQSEVIIEAGYVKPITAVNLSNRGDMTKAIRIHYALLRCTSELDQLISGLSVMGIGEAIKNNRELFFPLFTSGKTPLLTAEYLRALFGCIYYSEKGSNEREKEESTYMLFIDFLYDCQCEDKDISLKNVLSFFTGTEIPPPLGFNTTPSLRFDQNIIYPTASTCALELTLPTQYHSNEESFKEKMTYGILHHGGFGFS